MPDETTVAPYGGLSGSYGCINYKLVGIGSNCKRGRERKSKKFYAFVLHIREALHSLKKTHKITSFSVLKERGFKPSSTPTHWQGEQHGKRGSTPFSVGFRNRNRTKLAHKPATKQEQKKEYVELGQETIISQPTSKTSSHSRITKL
jgi:hypothetical protein